jgi:hypothetical protein
VDADLRPPARVCRSISPPEDRSGYPIRTCGAQEDINQLAVRHAVDLDLAAAVLGAGCGDDLSTVPDTEIESLAEDIHELEDLKRTRGA